jgi:hypothetical protein
MEVEAAMIVLRVLMLLEVTASQHGLGDFVQLALLEQARFPGQ